MRSSSADAARPRARQAAGRSAHRPHDARREGRRLPGRDAGHRERAGGARSARAPARKAAGGRPGAPALSRRALGFPEPARALAILRRRAGGESYRIASWSSNAARTSFPILRLREWRDLHRQLSEQVAELGWRWTDALPDKIDAARYEAIHRALLAGLLSNIGCRADGDEHYLGTRGLKFFLHPGSGIAKKGAEMGARGRADRHDAAVRALRRTGRAGMDRAGRRDRSSTAPISIRSWDAGARRSRRRRAGRALRPDAGAAAAGFVRRDRSGGARAKYSCAKRWSPASSRPRARFFAHNRQLIAAIAELEHKARRQDVLVDDEALYAFYAERVPAGIHSTRVASSAGASRRRSRAIRACCT